MQTRSICIAITLALASCATPAPIKETKSGKPEAIFVGERPGEVQAKIANLCLDVGYTIPENSSSNILCTRDTNSTEEFMVRAFFTGAYSSKPQRKMRFALVELEEGVRVVATQWLEAQMPGGRVETIPQDDNVPLRNELQQRLLALGGI